VVKSWYEPEKSGVVPTTSARNDAKEKRVGAIKHGSAKGTPQGSHSGNDRPRLKGSSEIQALADAPKMNRVAIMVGLSTG